MKLRINWDTLGIASSLACAIHCALLPLFLSGLPLLGVNIINNVAFEAFMIGLAFIIGIYSLYHGYRLHHHRIWPIIIFTAGIFFLVLKQFVMHYEIWLLFPAVIFIISGHMLNYRFCRIANHCHANDCKH